MSNVKETSYHSDTDFSDGESSKGSADASLKAKKAPTLPKKAPTLLDLLCSDS